MPKGIYKHKPLSEITKKRVSLSLLGNKRSLGHKQSKEHIEKRMISLRGKERPPLSEEHKRKVGLAFKGRQHTEDWKRNKSAEMKGSKNHFWHKSHTEESKLKNRLSCLTRVMPFKNTAIEIKLQNLLKENNIEFETHYPILGRPDIFIKPNICIFADGCYWHKCSECGFGEGKERDEMVTRELQSRGYTVIRLWEHEIKKLNSLSWLES